MNTSLTFDVSHDDHDEEAMVVGVVGVVNAGGDLASADDFFQGDQHQLDGQEGHALIEEVQGAVEDEVPEEEEPGVRERGWYTGHVLKLHSHSWPPGCDFSGCIEVYASCVKAAFSLLTTRGRIFKDV